MRIFFDYFVDRRDSVLKTSGAKARIYLICGPLPEGSGNEVKETFLKIAPGELVEITT